VDIDADFPKLGMGQRKIGILKVMSKILEK